MIQVPEPKQDTEGKWIAKRQGEILCEGQTLNEAINKIREMDEKDRKGVIFQYLRKE